MEFKGKNSLQNIKIDGNTVITIMEFKASGDIDWASLEIYTVITIMEFKVYPGTSCPYESI